MLTSVEQRLEIYRDSTNTPTVASSVMPETPLCELNLDWRERDLPERVRTKHVHRLHPYLGKYIPQLVEIFLRKYFTADMTILDPFCGSGTTLVQANELAMNAVGCDISEFNIILSRAKTTRYNIANMRSEVMDVLEKTRQMVIKNDLQPSLWDIESIHLPEHNGDEYLHRWYSPRALRELLVYRGLIMSQGYRYTDLMQVILSRAARSARLTTHFELDFPKRPQTEPYYCYKHFRECKPTEEAYKFIERYSVDSIKRIEAYSQVRTNASVTIHHADSRSMAFPAIDGVITSPPYVGLIDYHEQHAYAYHLLDLEDKRESEIGAAVSGSSQQAKVNYQQGIASVFRHITDVMPAGGRMIVVAGDRHDLYGKIAEMVGVEVEAVVQRHVNRRTGRRSSEFYESVFVWRKA